MIHSFYIIEIFRTLLHLIHLCTIFSVVLASSSLHTCTQICCNSSVVFSITFTPSVPHHVIISVKIKNYAYGFSPELFIHLYPSFAIYQICSYQKFVSAHTYHGVCPDTTPGEGPFENMEANCLKLCCPLYFPPHVPIQHI